MPAARALSVSFKAALMAGGPLHPILEAVQGDDTLLLGLREGYISLYYRGGQLLRITSCSNDRFSLEFSARYDPRSELRSRLERHGSADVLSRGIAGMEDSRAVVEVFGELKGFMDRHDKIRGGHEREFQQLAARVNNRSRSSSSSNYFITDIELAEESARFDMLGAYRHERKERDRLVPVLFEMKYGESSLGGGAGLLKHLKDLLDHVLDDGKRAAMRDTLAAQFEQLSALNLLQYNREKKPVVHRVVEDRVKVVFVLAEYTPRSTHLVKLLDELDALISDEYESKFAAKNLSVEVRFAGASLCGYAMHEATMLTTDQVRRLLGAWNPPRERAASA